MIDGLDTFVANKYLCTENRVGATSCHTNNIQIFPPAFGYSLGGDIYQSATDSDTGVNYAKIPVIGIYDVPVISESNYPTQASFSAAFPGMTTISYDALASGRLPTYAYTFA